MAEIRTFESGATRDSDDGKYDYEGFLSPSVLRRFAAYMHTHRKQADGNLRDSANWQKGIPFDSYMKSAWRHFLDWWTAHREGRVDQDALCAMFFNVQGYLHEALKLKAAPLTLARNEQARERASRPFQVGDVVRCLVDVIPGLDAADTGWRDQEGTVIACTSDVVDVKFASGDSWLLEPDQLELVRVPKMREVL